MISLGWRAILAASDDNAPQPPAHPDDLARVEASLGAVLAPDLRALYLVSDGVYSKSGQWFVIWPLADVLSRNRSAWTRWENATRRHLLAFGDDGTGNPFCVARDGSPGVLAWNPIDQEAHRLAGTLDEFWAAWSTRGRQ